MMPTEEKKGTGLLPLPVNPSETKDFSHSVVFGATKEDDVPFDFSTNLLPLKIKDQKQLDFCPGFATTEVSEDQEGFELDPLWQFAQIKRWVISKGGTLESYGADLRSAGMALVKYGSLPQIHAPYTVNSGERNFLANPENYKSELGNIAVTYRKKSMFFVDGPNDVFGNILAVLWKNKSKKVSIIVGVPWRKSWTYSPDGIVPAIGWADEPGEGHCLKIFDMKVINGQQYLAVQNSWGTGVGKGGIFYFPRSIINREFGPYGQIYFSDMSVDDAKYYNESGVSVYDNWLMGLCKSFYHLFFKI